jgi:hypothetical protein
MTTRRAIFRLTLRTHAYVDISPEVPESEQPVLLRV